MPLGVGEVEAQLIAQVHVAQQQFDLIVTGRLIDIVRGLPAENMLGALGHDSFVTGFLYAVSHFVGIEQLGIPEHGRTLTEQILNEIRLRLELTVKLVLVHLRSQRISVGHAHELHALGLRQLFEGIDHLGSKLLKQT